MPILRTASCFATETLSPFLITCRYVGRDISWRLDAAAWQ
jgi:hypothetical protein